MEELFIKAIDGYKLSALYFQRPGRKAGMIVISSATGVRKEFYINFAWYLMQKGYTVLLYDYRGIGGSAAADPALSESYMHEWGTRDMNAVLDYLVNEKGWSDVIWVGHSVGAQLVGFLRRQHHIQRVIAVNTAFGYWKYFPFPRNLVIWFMWYFVGPALVKIYGYGAMKKIGWGENLPKNILKEWRSWCLNKYYYRGLIRKKLRADNFQEFDRPITAVYMSDDFIANDRTVPMMRYFFPNAPYEIVKLPVEKYTMHKVGHIGIFRKKFSQSLWPLLAKIIEGERVVNGELERWSIRGKVECSN